MEDKTLWHEALAHYRAWNEAQFADRVRRTSEQSLTEKWQAYQDLMVFCWRVNPEPSEWEQTQTQFAQLLEQREILAHYCDIQNRIAAVRGETG